MPRHCRGTTVAPAVPMPLVGWRDDGQQSKPTSCEISLARCRFAGWAPIAPQPRVVLRAQSAAEYWKFAVLD